MADGGYTPREVDKFTLADVTLLFDYWGDHPSLRSMAAAYLGIKPKGSRDTPGEVHIPSPGQMAGGISAAAIRAAYPGGIVRG